MTGSAELHYLQRELYELVREDPSIFDFLQAGSLDGLWYWDVTDPDHEWMSPRFKELFGYEDHEVPNVSSWWMEHIHPDDLPVALENFDRHLEDPDHPYDQVVRYRHKDGSTVWVRCRGIAVRDAAGAPIRLLGCHTDLTALKQTEEQLARRNAELQAALDDAERVNRELERSAADLARSNRDLEQFAYLVSHDLREPLRMVRTFAEKLVDRVGAAADDRSQQYLGFLVDGSERMTELINGLLEYSRAGRAEVDARPVDVGEVTGVVAQWFAPHLAESGGSISLPDQPLVVLADRVLLERMIQNLLSNAVRFVEAGQAPSVTVDGWANADGTVSVAVTDAGIGIPAQFHERVFQIFQRLHTRDEYPGSGLGLALVRRLAESHRGRVDIDAGHRGPGTRFVLTLPGAVEAGPR